MDVTTGGRCTFKDLCIDAGEPGTMAAFWASALGLRVETLDTGAFRLVDEVAAHTVWVNRVPEPRTVKQRVHLDVTVADVAELQEIGARLLGDEPRWTVLADPEGGELCAFVRPADRRGRYRLLEVVVDARDPAAIAAWWAERWGVEARPGDDGSFWSLGPGGGLPAAWVFQAVPEPKRVKNRIHWDVLGNSRGLLEAGATLLRPRDEVIFWDQLADPEGNEFCVFSP